MRIIVTHLQFALDVDDSTFVGSIQRAGRYKLIYQKNVNIRVSHHTVGVDDPFVVIDREPIMWTIAHSVLVFVFVDFFRKIASSHSVQNK